MVKQKQRIYQDFFNLYLLATNRYKSMVLPSEGRGQGFESLRARHLRTKPRTCAVSGGLPAITVAREAFSPIILILSAPTSISEITEWR